MENEITKKILEYIDGTKDFLLENAPSFFQEVVAYGRFMSFFYLCACPVLLIICLSFVWYHMKNIKNDNTRPYKDLNDGCMKHVIFTIIFCVFSLVFFCTACSGFEMSILAWSAPKLFILKYLKA